MINVSSPSDSARSLRPVGMTTAKRGRGSRSCSRNTPGTQMTISYWDDETESRAELIEWYPNTRRAALVAASRDYPGCRYLNATACTLGEWLDADFERPFTDEDYRKAYVAALVNQVLSEEED